MIKKFVNAVLLYLGAIASLLTIWKELDIQTPELVWAYSVTTVFLVIYLSISVCIFRQSVFLTRIEQCADAKKRLEKQILKNRKSSEKKQ